MSIPGNPFFPELRLSPSGPPRGLGPGFVVRQLQQIVDVDEDIVVPVAPGIIIPDLVVVVLNPVPQLRYGGFFYADLGVEAGETSGFVLIDVERSIDLGVSWTSLTTSSHGPPTIAAEASGQYRVDLPFGSYVATEGLAEIRFRPRFTLSPAGTRVINIKAGLKSGFGHIEEVV